MVSPSGDILLEKQVPHSIDAEKAILGAILLDNSLFAEIASLPADRFYALSHRNILRAMKGLADRGMPIDPIGVQEEMRRSDTLDASGGPAYLSSLFDGVPRFSNIENYVRIVGETAAEREMVHAGAAITTLAMDESVPVAEKLARAQQIITGIQDPNAKIQWTNVGEIAMGRLLAAEDFAASGRAYSGMPTGLYAIDGITDGLQKTDLIIIAARPSMGKSCLTSVIAEGAAAQPENDNPVIGIFSLEMGKDQYVDRMIASHARVDMRAMKRGCLHQDGIRRAARAQDWYSTRRLFVDGESAITPAQMRAKCKALKKQEGRIDLLIVDYVQAMCADRPSGKNTEDVTQISKQLKAIAKEYDVPMIGVASLNRLAEGRSDKKPAMSDLRESGQLESDADVIALLYRDDYYNPNSEKQNIAELNFVKHRNGPTGMIELVFLRSIARFEDPFRRPGEGE